MGYYIQTSGHFNKAKAIAEAYNGTVLSTPPSTFTDIPEDKALIIVVRNAMFEAAAYAYDDREFEAFTDPDDERPKQYVLIDKETAEIASGRSKEKAS